VSGHRGGPWTPALPEVCAEVPVKLLVKSCPDAFFRMGDGERGGQSFPAPAPDVTEATTEEAGSAV
jgi:hypothetical protein